LYSKIDKCDTRGGGLIFNIDVTAEEEMEAEIDSILDKNFKKVKKVKYGRFNSQYLKFISLPLAVLMILTPSFRKNKKTDRLYYFAEKKKVQPEKLCQ